MLYIRFLCGITYFLRSSDLRLADSSSGGRAATNTSFFSTFPLTEKVCNESHVLICQLR